MPVSEYETLDLLIERFGTEYRARIINSPVGQARTSFASPFNATELAAFLARVGMRGSVAETSVRSAEFVRQLGRRLFDAAFNGEVLTSYRRSRDVAERDQKGLRIRLRLNDVPELADLPWEYMYDASRNQFLALSKETPIVRYLELPERVEPLAAPAPLNLLAVLSSPSDRDSLDVDDEWTRLQDALQELRAAGKITLTRLQPPTLDALRAQLRKNEYHIFHFIGHGEYDATKELGALVFETEAATARKVNENMLATLLHDARNLRVAVLNACVGVQTSLSNPFMGMAPHLVEQGIPAVLAMQFAISDQAGLDFSSELYRTLADGYPIDAALNEARRAMYLNGDVLGWGTPVLFSRAEEGVIFELLAPAGLEKAAEELERRREAELTRIASEQKIVATYSSRLLAIRDVQGLASGYRDLPQPTPVSNDPIANRLQTLSRISRDTEVALNQSSSYNQRLALKIVVDELGNFGSDLRISSTPYASDFLPIVDLWQTILTEYIARLEARGEQQQEVDNPYVIGVPLTLEQKIFVGRWDVGSRIENLIRDQRRPPILLYGQRRMGKTSLLNNLGRLLPSRIVPMFVDLQGPVTAAADQIGMLANLSQAMVESASRHRNLSILPLTRDLLTGDPFTRFDNWLDDVENTLGRNTALLCLDEFESLDYAISRGRFDREEVLGMLRHWIQHRLKFKLLLAGSHSLEELKYWSSYLINVQIIKLGYLKDDEALHLVEHPVQDFPLQYEPSATLRVIQLTRGHPYLVQLLCSEIVEVKNQQTLSVRLKVRPNDVENAVSAALGSGAMFFSDIRQTQIDESGYRVLKFIADELRAKPNASSSSKLLDSIFGRKTVGLRRSVPRSTLVTKFGARLENSLSLLMQRDLIEQEDGGYRFQVELIQKWFEQSSD